MESFSWDPSFTLAETSAIVCPPWGNKTAGGVLGTPHSRFWGGHDTPFLQVLEEKNLRCQLHPLEIPVVLEDLGLPHFCSLELFPNDWSSQVLGLFLLLASLLGGPHSPVTSAFHSCVALRAHILPEPQLLPGHRTAFLWSPGCRPLGVPSHPVHPILASASSLADSRTLSQLYFLGPRKAPGITHCLPTPGASHCPHQFTHTHFGER